MSLQSFWHPGWTRVVLAGLVLTAGAGAQTFIARQASFATGTQPAGVVMADFNGDGRPDLAVTNEEDNTVSVLLTKADGSVAAKVDYGVGGSPLGVASGDFNGDHIPDLVVVNSQDNTVSILLGKGDGTFQGQVTYVTGKTPSAVVVVDLNNDQKLDLAISNEGDDNVSILMGKGDGTFQPQTVTGTTLPDTIQIVSADLNVDGKPDLAVLNDMGAVSLLINNGTTNGSASFTIGLFDSGITVTAEMAIGDLNGDGYPDIAVAGSAVVVGLGGSSGHYQAVSTSLAVAGETIAMGDFNGDGKQDLFVGAQESGKFLLFLAGNGDGTFQPVVYNDSPVDAPLLMAGDFNNDGCLDLIALDDLDGIVRVQLGDGAGHVGNRNDVSTVGYTWILPGDFNGDGKLDAVMLNFDSSGTHGYIVLPGNGDGTFQKSVSTTVAGNSDGSIVVGDFNGDGKLDVAQQSVWNMLLAPGNGDGTFGAAVTTALSYGASVQSMTAGDFNHDGRDDIIMTEYGPNPGVYALLGKSDGTFQVNAVVNYNGLPTGAAVGDFNHDGKLDFAFIDINSGVSPSLFVYMGNGDGTFIASGSYVTGNVDPSTGTARASNNAGIATADFNGDGKLDLVVTAGNYVLYLQGNGDGTFQTAVPVLTMPNTTGPVLTGDFNGDGRPDLMVWPYGVMTGNGDGTFGAVNPFHGTYYNESYFGAGDFNGDGIPDLIAMSTSQIPNVYNTATSVWLSAPAVSFSTAQLSFGQQALGVASAPAMVEMDNVGSAPMTLSRIQASGDFSESDHCPTTMMLGQGCGVSATFTPTGGGMRKGSLTFTDTSAPKTQVVLLTGSGPALPPAVLLTVGSSSLSIAAAGSSGTDQIQASSQYGFSGAVNLSCAVSYAGAGSATDMPTCSIIPAQVQATASTAGSAVLTISTTMGTHVGEVRNPWLPAEGDILAAGLLLGFWRRRGLGAKLLILMVIFAVATIGCSGGGGGSSAPVVDPGTTVGNYQVTVTAISSAATVTTVVAMTIK